MKMHVKSIVSVIAISAALILGGSAYAQTMFNGVELAGGDVAAVTERCAQLVQDAANPTTTGSGGAQASDSEAPATDGSSDTAVSSTEPPNELEAATTTYDLDSVTLEQCTAAGLPAPAM